MGKGLAIRTKRNFSFAWVFWTIIAILLVSACFFGYRYFTAGDLPPFISAKALQADPRVSEDEVTKGDVVKHEVPPSHPRYLSIPELGISDTRVFSVGVDKNNQLIAPDNIFDSAWFDKSATPGSGYGAVLINAHNGGVTRDGVFAKLKTLEKGAEITVTRGDGKEFTYQVVENKSMPLEEVNKTGMQQMMNSIDPSKEGLSLITCDGKWVPKYKQYDRRIMLRAVLVNVSST